LKPFSEYQISLNIKREWSVKLARFQNFALNQSVYRQTSRLLLEFEKAKKLGLSDVISDSVMSYLELDILSLTRRQEPSGGSRP
jgi:hypothetical protein